MSELTATNGAEAQEVKLTSTGKVRKTTEAGTIGEITISYNGQDYTYEPARKVTEGKAADIKESLYKAVALMDEVSVSAVTTARKGSYIGQPATSRSLITSLVKEHHMNTEDVSVFLNLFIKYRKPAGFETHGVDFDTRFISNEIINKLKKAYNLSNFRAVEKPNFNFDEDDTTLEDTAETTISGGMQEIAADDVEMEGNDEEEYEETEE